MSLCIMDIFKIVELDTFLMKRIEQKFHNDNYLVSNKFEKYLAEKKIYQETT